jgi:hypothetical protein
MRDRNIYSENICLKPEVSLVMAEAQMHVVIDKLNAAFDRFERGSDAKREVARRKNRVARASSRQFSDGDQHAY